MRGKRFLRGLAFLFLFGAGCAGALAIWIRAPFKGFSGGSATVEFPIGTSTREIFRTLRAAGVVRNAFLAESYYGLRFEGRALRAGEYSFSGNETLDGVLGRIIAGEVVQHSVTVPEGLSGKETFALFLAERVGTEAGFERAWRETRLLPWVSSEYTDVEGFLFPDTYLVTRSTPTREILARMIRNFDRHVTPELKGKIEDRHLTLRQIVTVASLVEKETSLSAERPHVAAVYWNRLKIGMRLQCDPTVIYSLERDGKWSGRLRRDDLEYDSPYNTYLHEGLPPGPICNPGAASIAAAISPSGGADIYFVARGDGGHYFSRTYAEHLLRIEQSRANTRALSAEPASGPN